MHQLVEDLSPSGRWWLLAAFAAVAVLALLAMAPSHRTLVEHGSGIVPFEKAGADGVRAIVEGWGPEGVRAARHNLALDFPLLVGYGGALFVGSLIAGASLTPLRGLFLAAAYAGVLAAVLDVVENVLLLAVLDDPGRGTAADLAAAAATAKFALVGASAAVATLGLAVVVVLLVRSRRRDRQEVPA